MNAIMQYDPATWEILYSFLLSLAALTIFQFLCKAKSWQQRFEIASELVHSAAIPDFSGIELNSQIGSAQSYNKVITRVT